MKEKTEFPGFDSIRAEYVPLKSNEWIQKHDIRKQGRNRGRKDLPATMESQDDSVYSEITEFIGQRARECRESVIKFIDDQIADMTAQTKEWEGENPEITLQQKVDKGSSDLDSIASQDHNHVNTCLQHKKQAEAELTEFQGKNKLTRVAEYPTSQIAHWSWVPVAGIIESFVSANLLGSVSRGGTVEGWVVAVVLTLVNVLCGIGAGWSCRLLSHVNSALKTIGAIGFMLSLVVAVLWNTVAGHVRDAYVLAEASGDLDSIDTAFARAVQILLESPLPWDSLQSAGLVFVGIAVFVLTTYKAFTSDDRYLGYGRRHRQVESLTNQYEMARDEALTRLKQARDALDIEIDEFKDHHTMCKASWETSHEKIVSILNEYEVNLAQYNLDLSFLLATYRDANLEARNTPAPAFFNEKHEVDSAVLSRPSIEIPSPLAWGDIQHIAQDGFNKISKVHDAWRERYEILDTNFAVDESK